MSIFSDINQFDAQRTPKVFDVESIYQSITNILTTPIGSRIFNPEFGSRVEELLFDLMDEITVLKLKTAAIEAIERWEPRVTVNHAATVVEPDMLNRKYTLNLVFNVKSIGNMQYIYTGNLLRPNG